MTKKLITTIVLVLIIGFCLDQLFWGRLFPWSPLKIGYRPIQTAKATVILPNTVQFPKELQNINQLFSQVEQFHQLRFTKRVAIILPKNFSQFIKFTGQTGVACSLQTGTVIYLSPKIIDEKRDMAVILKHELSHIILYQHTSFFKSTKIPRWLNEGVAIYSGNPHDYYEGEDFSKLAVGRKYFFDILNPDQAVKKIPRKYRNKFIYAEYRGFIEYLVNQHGIEKLRKYLKEVINQPKMEKELFKQIYQVEFSNMVLDFKAGISTNY